jgi:pyruvate,orthophosphate dikinase
MDFIEITPSADIFIEQHGARAKCLQRLMRLDMPVPRTVAIPFDVVGRLAAGDRIDTADLWSIFPDDSLVSVRPSAETSDWGGPTSVLNIGMNAERAGKIAEGFGQERAADLHLRFIQGYAVEVTRLDVELFPPAQTIDAALATYEAEMDEAFPTDPAVQLGEVLRSMARAWAGTSARLLRQAKGAPADAGLGLVVQRMATGTGAGECGSGLAQFINPQTGLRKMTGRYKPRGQGRVALNASGAMFLQADPRGASLQERCPEAFEELLELGERSREGLREEMQIEFTVEDCALRVLDAVRVPRSPRAALRVAVDLTEDGVIPRDEALMRVEPQALTELLHPQIDPDAARTVIAHGIAASPGAATGKIVFSANAAQVAAAQGEACVLLRHETVPEDIRGMHAAQAVLTERGGMTSHAAVIARGLGVPCVVGASALRINTRDKTVTTETGQILHEGDVITIDGSAGQALLGAAPMVEAALDDTFQTFMGWADEVADIAVRANADTPSDAQTARRFQAKGIGLCRTEHMFFEDGRLTVMREMIFAGNEADRRAALDRLLPMQRDDFTQLFQIMAGQAVCIRLLDPPLHEFLPHGREGIRQLADALDLPISQVTRRIESLEEVNPMLGMRGVRLGVVMPEIYEMQARAIFEAVARVSGMGMTVVPEIMIPLVSANREVEMVKTRIDASAAAVRTETNLDFNYKIGVMVETPRAALKAGEISEHASFLSFGTNDLTQMTYGLSRDDAGRFMGTYVQQGVYPEDPFHILDAEGVGELLLLAAERGRAHNPDLTLSICGEHGGNAESIAFCRRAGFDYVSCSPYRVPVARLAAAQLALSDSPNHAGRATVSNWLMRIVGRKNTL